MDARIFRRAPRNRLSGDAVQGLVAHSDARFFDKQRDEGPKLDTSGKPEPPAEEASRGREMRKELNNLDLLNSDRGTTHGMYQSSRSDSAFN